jgi:hypothetical protein
VGIDMNVARGGMRICENEIAKPAIIRGTMSQETRTVLRGLIREILLKYQIETGVVIRNTIHDSKNTSRKGDIFFSNLEDTMSQTIIPIVAKTES